MARKSASRVAGRKMAGKSWMVLLLAVPLAAGAQAPEQGGTWGTLASYTCTLSVGGEALFWPSGLAVNRAGELCVLDGGKISRYSPAGKLLGRFSCAAGDGALGISGDTGRLAVDSKGCFYVAAGREGGLQVYTPQGTLRQQIAPASLAEPGAVAVDGEGNVWVLDYSQGRIIKFREARPAGSIPAPGQELGNLQMAAFCLDQQGRVWVLDVGSRRVLQFDGAGKLQRALPLGEAGEGGEWLGAIAADRQGRVYAALGFADVVLRSNQQGQFERFVQATAGPIALTEAGELWVTEFLGHKETQRNAQGKPVRQEFRAQGARLCKYDQQGKLLVELGQPSGLPAHPTRLAVDGAGRLYLAAGGTQARVEVFDAQGRHTRSLPLGEPGEVCDLAADGSRLAVVLAAGEGKGGRRVCVVAVEGGQVSVLPGPGGDGPWAPEALAFGPEGELLVADAGQRRVVAYPSAGGEAPREKLRLDPAWGEVTDLCCLPGELAVATHKAIVSFDGAGNLARKLELTVPGQEQVLLRVAAAGGGGFFALQVLPSRVLHISREGKLLGALDGRLPEGRFTAAVDLAADRAGNLYVLDLVSGQLHRYSPRRR